MIVLIQGTALVHAAPVCCLVRSHAAPLPEVRHYLLQNRKVLLCYRLRQSLGPMPVVRDGCCRCGECITDAAAADAARRAPRRRGGDLPAQRSRLRQHARRDRRVKGLLGVLLKQACAWQVLFDADPLTLLKLQHAATLINEPAAKRPAHCCG